MTGTDKFINAFVNTNPVGATDPKSQGDDHLRGIKNILINTFPNITGAVTATQAQLNLTVSATEANTASTIVKRDASGNFAANRITADTIGDVYASNGTFRVIDSGTDGTDATFIGDVFSDGGAARVVFNGTDGTDAWVKAGIVETGASAGVVRTKIIDIGPWNMDSTAVLSVAHGLDHTKIRPPMLAIIQDNSSTGAYPLDRQESHLDTAQAGCISQADSTNVNLLRTNGGFFDDGAFNSGINRGWITVTYID